MACRHGDYEGAACAHCSDAAQKRRELAERIGELFGFPAGCECENCTEKIAAIERVLAEQEGHKS